MRPTLASLPGRSWTPYGVGNFPEDRPIAGPAFGFGASDHFGTIGAQSSPLGPVGGDPSLLMSWLGVFQQLAQLARQMPQQDSPRGSGMSALREMGQLSSSQLSKDQLGSRGEGGFASTHGTAPVPARALPALSESPPTAAGSTQKATYRPKSAEAIELFKKAARSAGLPESWATAPALHKLLARESGGQVGRPNYTYGRRASDPSKWPSIHQELKSGRRTAASTASGLGQLLLSNVDKYYPSGRRGIGNAHEEAVGMLRYIKDRYGSPENAWRQYGRNHEGY